jgi:hypothetical protein
MTDSQMHDLPDADAPSASMTPARRHGFALPLAILVLAVLTVGLAASFASTGTEILTNAAQRNESRAYIIAENGLQEFIALRDQKQCAKCGYPPTVMYESTTVYMPGGRAEVVAQRVMKNVGITRPAVYLIRSRGVDSVALNGVTKKYDIPAERVVAQYAYWDMKTINIVSGWTSLSGLSVQGSAGTIAGSDKCSANPTIAGVAVPSGAYSQTGKDSVAKGDPPVLDLGPTATAAANTKIDWAGIRNETSITPDYSIPGGGTVPASAFADSLAWPIIHVKGDYAISSGRGLLIVDGNVTFSGTGTWRGILLAGGNLTSNGSNSLYGAVITGLNVKIGLPVAQDDAGNGNKFYQYDSCSVAAATGGIGHYRLFPNAWMDNFTTY